MKTFVDEGDDLTLVAPAGGVVAGTMYQIGQILAVAKVSAAAGENFAASTRGKFTLAKLSAQAWTVGQLVYYDSANEWITTVATGSQLVGVATAVADNPSATGEVRLNGTFRADEA